MVQSGPWDLEPGDSRTHFLGTLPFKLEPWDQFPVDLRARTMGPTERASFWKKTLLRPFNRLDSDSFIQFFTK